ncbi:MAG: hypothetical protein B7X90_11165 [Novosphingobium sp. 17-62-19]|uniref:hypothetical protein n=1 Tax=Novosphingobium sp. 17-62-19 TaxID=1970406 RepID=UPI000BDDC8A2|nr:hypothetical protein [Novosphingobium sp. 17-62-19]OZA18728.1 MAG: hypothetical protein B7X90_11165 [Novosphingobium sp. 17-62-19]HQS97327.1 hypothetical protein [Novosphingobium sp.]
MGTLGEQNARFIRLERFAMSAEGYLTARTKFSNTLAELKQMVDVIGSVGSVLRDSPDRFIFANQPIGLPMEATMTSDARSTDAGAWPSVEKIMMLLKRYHDEKVAMQNAWDALPQATKDAMKSPNDLIKRRSW